MKVFLVRGKSARPINRFYPNLGIVSIASVIRNFCDVKIFDLGLSGNENFIQNVKKHKPDIIGFTTSIDDYGEVLNLASICKRISPKLVIITGGPHSTLIGKNALNYRDVDITVCGEGEETVIKLLKAIEKGEDFSKINGIIYREGEKIKKNERTRFYDLDKQPLPSWDLYNLKNFFPILPIETSRGCPYQCPYCAEGWINGVMVRQKSVKHVVKEIEYCKEFGVKHFRFADSTFNFKKERLIELTRAFLDSNLEITWSAYARFETIDEDSLKLAKESGCVSLYFGIESGDDQVLRNMRNSYNWEHIKHIQKIAKKIGLHLHCNFIVGFPDETELNVNNTLKVIKQVRPDSTFVSTFFVVPMTETHREANRYGIEFIDPNWVSNLHTFFKEPKFYFRHRTMTQKDMRKHVERIRQEVERIGGIFWNLKDYPLLTWLSVGGKAEDLKKIWKDPGKHISKKELKYFEAFKEKEIYEIEKDDERTSKIKDRITSLAKQKLNN